MSDIIIDIASNIGRDLKSRTAVKSLLLDIRKKNIFSFKIDFKNVDFASRSFMDEFYNQFIANKEIKVDLINLSRDLQQLIESVETTQHKKHIFFKDTFLSKPDLKFESISEANKYLEALHF